MNLKRLLLAMLAGFAFVFLSDFLVHGVWLMPDYKATAALWRTDPEMMARFPWMTGAQLLCAATFVLIWAAGFAERDCFRAALSYGVMMGLFAQVSTLVMFVVTPMPGLLAAKWFIAGVAQSLLLGILTFFIYKPARAQAALPHHL